MVFKFLENYFEFLPKILAIFESIFMVKLNLMNVIQNHIVFYCMKLYKVKTKKYKFSSDYFKDNHR